MLKKFKITWKRHGSVATYDHTEIVEARSEKFAWKKFYNHKELFGDRTRKQSMDYEREALGIYCTDFNITEVKA